MLFLNSSPVVAIITNRLWSGFLAAIELRLRLPSLKSHTHLISRIDCGEKLHRDMLPAGICHMHHYHLSGSESPDACAVTTITVRRLCSTVRAPGDTCIRYILLYTIGACIVLTVP